MRALSSHELRTIDLASVGVALPEPYIGEFYRRGAGCGLCNDVWCGDGACSCGSSWTTEMVLGEEPDPADEDFWTVAAAR
ncbi:MAG: hypothetical protein KC621_01825 [Myxococcales bacterium]|nr:hypothetical protein [Myxococcales bacterium]